MQRIAKMLLILLAFNPSWVQAEQGVIDTVLEYFGSSDEIDLSNGMDWGVLPGPFSNPEQGVGIGAAAVGLYSPQGEGAGNQISNLTFSGFATSEGSYGLGVSSATFLNGDSFIFRFDGGFGESPTNYWGIGRDDAEDDSRETRHEAMYVRIQPSVAYEFYQNYYLKLGMDGYFLFDQEAMGLALSQAELDNKSLVGATLALEYDSRDYETNPYSGRLISFENRWYLSQLGSDFDYQQFTFNYREYLTLYKQNVIAFEYYFQGLSDEEHLPWFAMSLLGGDSRMRGYYEGKYRDRLQMSAQIEYRHRFSQRHGLVVWGGAGNVASECDQIFEQSWLPTYGVGYRFAFKPRVNVRLDLAFGDETTLYFNLHEAF